MILLMSDFHGVAETAAGWPVPGPRDGSGSDEGVLLEIHLEHVGVVVRQALAFMRHVNP